MYLDHSFGGSRAWLQIWQGLHGDVEDRWQEHLQEPASEFISNQEQRQRSTNKISAITTMHKYTVAHLHHGIVFSHNLTTPYMWSAVD
jgi:hypothetical protein